MEYSSYPYQGYAYQDSWSTAAGDQSSTWGWDDSTQHAPRRLQHGYSEEEGSYTYDVGSLREDDPYRIQPRSSASRRAASSSTSHGRSAEDTYRHSDKPSSKRREEREKKTSGRSSASASTSASSSSRAASWGSSAATIYEQPSKSRSSHSGPPRAPTIERLATPELAPLSAGLQFCTCGCSDGYHDEEERYKQGRAKMDSQLQYATRHISRH